MVWVICDLILFSFEGTNICNFKIAKDFRWSARNVNVEERSVLGYVSTAKHDT